MTKTRDARVKNSLSDGDSIPGNCLRAGQFPGRQLDHGKAAQRAHDPSRRNIGARLDDPAVAGGEEDVDRKPHEERVHHVRRRDDQGMARGKRIAPQKAALSCRRVERRFECGRYRKPGALVDEPEGPPLSLEERTEEMCLHGSERRQGMPVRMIGIRNRYFTGWPFRVAGLNFQAFAAATSMRS
jgi:hypothetical protein